jgi:hypothetical protein
MVDISTLSNSNYLNAADLQGRNRQVTIANAELKAMESDGKTKLVVYFQGVEKGLVCNKTNMETIADMVNATDTDHWPGKQITLTTKIAEYNGKKSPAIRVMDQWDIPGNHQPVDAHLYSNQPDTSPFVSIAQQQMQQQPQQNFQQTNGSQQAIDQGPVGYPDDPGFGA